MQCSLGCQASATDVQNAVQQFTSPDVESSKAANAAALGRKLKQKAPPASQTTVTVLNGNGVAGAAANASYLLGPAGLPHADSARQRPSRMRRGELFHTKIYYDPSQKRSAAAAKALQNLVQPADVEKLPQRAEAAALDPGSMLLVVLGETFHGTIAPAPQQNVPVHQPAYVSFDAAPATALLQPLAKKVPFR